MLSQHESSGLGCGALLHPVPLVDSDDPGRKGNGNWARVWSWTGELGKMMMQWTSQRPFWDTVASSWVRAWESVL